MKILLISDTHEDISKVMDILDRIGDIDMIIHCGDHQFDARLIGRRVEIPVVSVPGNCDCGEDYHKIVETPAGKLLVTHGHKEIAGFTDDYLISAAEEEDGCIAVCFGHTHIPCIKEAGGLRLINPGSLTEPRGDSQPSYALLYCEEGSFRADLEDYNTLMQTTEPLHPKETEAGEGSAASAPCEGKKKKKAKGGFLRNLLNYSDRF